MEDFDFPSERGFTVEAAGEENPRSHGLPGKTLVYEGIQFYCIQCGSKLVENLHNRKLIYCSNAACQHNGWQLERPDLRSVYIVQKPKGDSNEQRE
jgi:hypothetical protein